MPRGCYDLPTQERHGFLWNGKFAVYYCDGAASNNGYANATSGCGVYGGPRLKRSFRNPAGQRNPNHNTNNFAELCAIEEALDIASDRELGFVEIRTDSMYCINAIREWSPGWQARANGGLWRSNKGNIIEHQYVIENILKLEKYFNQVDYEYVKGHGSDYGNEVANDLAQAAC